MKSVVTSVATRVAFRLDVRGHTRAILPPPNFLNPQDASFYRGGPRKRRKCDIPSSQIIGSIFISEQIIVTLFLNIPFCALNRRALVICDQKGGQGNKQKGVHLHVPGQLTLSN